MKNIVIREADQKDITLLWNFLKTRSHDERAFIDRVEQMILAADHHIAIAFYYYVYNLMDWRVGMDEKRVVERTNAPITVSKMTHDLRVAGVLQGDVVLIHSSLSSLGWVCGGPQAVVQALSSAVGNQGTLVMPAQSGDWSDPAEWQQPPVPREWFDIIYREWPAFDPVKTPTRGMGRIAELFRTFPGTIRSQHPQVSFCANGRYSEKIVSEHPLTPQFGMDSPLGKLYTSQAKVLLLGVGYDRCTCFHLAETLLRNMPTKRMGAAILEGGERVWKWFEDFAYDSDDFEKLGEQMEIHIDVLKGMIGQAAYKLFDMKKAVDFAVHWLGENR